MKKDHLCKETHKNANILKANTYESLKFVEGKHAALIALNGVAIFGVLSLGMEDGIKCYLPYVAAVSALFLVLSTIASLLSFFPKRGVKHHKSSGKNIFFNEELRKYSKEEIKEVLNNSSEFYDHMINWTFATAEVASRKYRLFRKATHSSVIGLGFMLIFLALYFIH